MRINKDGTVNKNELEKDFQKQVIDAAHLWNWKAAHFKAAIMPSGRWATPVQADGKGFPDLVLVRHLVLYVELKRPSAPLRPDQKNWIRWLLDAGQYVDVWTNEMLPRVLAILAHGPSNKVGLALSYM